MTNEGVKGLRNLDSLHSLAVSQTELADRHLKNIEELPLKSLDVSSTFVSNEGLAIVAKIETLEYLNVSGNSITDAGLPYLRGLKRLKHLTALHTQVTEEGARRLEKAIPGLEITYRIEACLRAETP